MKGCASNAKSAHGYSTAPSTPKKNDRIQNTIKSKLAAASPTLCADLQVLRGDLAEDQAGLEAVRQAADGLQVVVLGDTVVAHHGAPLLEAVRGVLVLVLALDVALDRYKNTLLHTRTKHMLLYTQPH